MTPEEHFRRMRDDQAWNRQAPPRRTTPRAGSIDGTTSRRTQMWTTAVVAAAVVAVAGVAISVAPRTGGAPAGPGAPGVASSEPAGSLPPSAQPSPTPTPVPSGPSLVHQTAASVPLQITPSASAVEPTAAPQEAEPSAQPQATTDAGHPAFAFAATDSADVARGQRVVACLRAKGVRYVDLAKPDAEGLRYLEFGGDRNDPQSISLGLQYSDVCIAAAGR